MSRSYKAPPRAARALASHPSRTPCPTSTHPHYINIMSEPAVGFTRPPPKQYSEEDILALPNNLSSAPFMKDLKEKGFCVIPNLVPKEKCDQYIDDALTWLEAFDLGFKRDDKSTWTQDHLPAHGKGGLYNRYGEYFYSRVS